jgi:hypothetical protein
MVGYNNVETGNEDTIEVSCGWWCNVQLGDGSNQPITAGNPYLMIMWYRSKLKVSGLRVDEGRSVQ